MTDDSIMPFGKYKGEKLRDVRASYLLWLNAQWDDNPIEEKENVNPVYLRVQKELKRYIEENLEILKMERNKER